MRLVKLVFLLVTLFFGSAVASEYAANKSEAAAIAMQKVSGRVLKIDEYKNKYRVKLLQESGRVVSIEVKRENKKKS